MPYYTGRGLQMPDVNLSNPIKPVTSGSHGLQMYQQSEGQALNYAKGMSQDIKAPSKTIGGGLTAGLSGAAAGAMISGGNPIGAGIGAIVGVGGYYLS